MRNNRSAASWDLLGISLSALCMVHCLALPLIIASLPALRLSWLADRNFHLCLAAVAAVIGATSFIGGYFDHGRVLIPAIGILGLTMLSLAALSEASSESLPACCQPGTTETGTWELLPFATPFAAILLISAHVLNCSHCWRCKNRRPQAPTPRQA
jgi:MerC mercury resistance protein